MAFVLAFFGALCIGMLWALQARFRGIGGGWCAGAGGHGTPVDQEIQDGSGGTRGTYRVWWGSSGYCLSCKSASRVDYGFGLVALAFLGISLWQSFKNVCHQRDSTRVSIRLIPLDLCCYWIHLLGFEWASPSVHRSLEIPTFLLVYMFSPVAIMWYHWVGVRCVRLVHWGGGFNSCIGICCLFFIVCRVFFQARWSA